MKRQFYFMLIILIAMIMYAIGHENNKKANYNEQELIALVKATDVEIFELTKNVFEFMSESKVKECESRVRELESVLRQEIESNEELSYKYSIITLHEDFILSTYRLLEGKIEIIKMDKLTSLEFDILLKDFGEKYGNVMKASN